MYTIFKLSKNNEGFKKQFKLDSKDDNGSFTQYNVSVDFILI